MIKIRTMKQEILDYIDTHPGLSAYQIATALGYPEKLGSISTLLKRLCDTNVLSRQDGLGPRGGFGYFTKEIS